MAESTQPPQKWLPLEANPQIWNKIIHSLNVDSQWEYVDILGFDSESLAAIPKPVEAIVFLFPMTEEYKKFKQEEEARLTKLEQSISANVIFFKQTIEGAGGMVALLHSVANNTDITIHPGYLQKFIDEAKPMSPNERAAELLEKSKELAEAHSEAVKGGRAEVSNAQEENELHFITFVRVDGHVYELDGKDPFPINHGEKLGLVESATKFIKQHIERDSSLEKRYSAMALVKKNTT